MLTIRDARLADAGAIVEGNLQMAWETEKLRLDGAILLAGVRAVLSDRTKGLYFVAEEDGAFLGQLMITWEWSDWRNGAIWWIQSVFVVPEKRRRGVFRALYSHARDAARREKAAGLRLYVEKNNNAAQATYRSLGMSKTHYEVMEEMLGGAK